MMFPRNLHFLALAALSAFLLGLIAGGSCCALVVPFCAVAAFAIFADLAELELFTGGFSSGSRARFFPVLAAVLLLSLPFWRVLLGPAAAAAAEGVAVITIFNASILLPGLSVVGNLGNARASSKLIPLSWVILSPAHVFIRRNGGRLGKCLGSILFNSSFLARSSCSRCCCCCCSKRLAPAVALRVAAIPFVDLLARKVFTAFWGGPCCAFGCGGRSGCPTSPVS